MEPRLPDLITIVESCVLFILITMLWIYRARPKNVPLSGTNGVLIPLRIFLVHAIIFVVLLPFRGTLAATLPFIAVMAICVLPFATIDNIPGGTSSAFSVGKMLMIPFYGLRQFIIGFPDRDTLMERRPDVVAPLYDPHAALWVEDE